MIRCIHVRVANCCDRISDWETKCVLQQRYLTVEVGDELCPSATLFDNRSSTLVESSCIQFRASSCSNRSSIGEILRVCY
jgi:hypothetical protein